MPFTVIADDHTGEADALCAECLFSEDGARVDVPMEPLVAERPSRRKTLKKNKKRSYQQDCEVAKDVSAYLQPASGATPGAKGDLRKKGELRIEDKFTTAKTFKLELEDLYKVASERGPGELALLVVDFLDQGTRKLRERFAVIHIEDLKELLNAARQHRGSQRTR